MVTLAAMLLQSLDSLPFWELHRQVHHIFKKKRKKSGFRKSMVLLLKFRQRNIVPLVLICTFYILFHWDYDVFRDFFVFCFRFPPFLAVVQPYRFSLLVQKDVVNSFSC